MSLLAAVFPRLVSFSFGLLAHSCVCSARSPSNCYFFKQISATRSRKKAKLQLFYLISRCQKLPQRHLSKLASSFLGPRPLGSESQSSQSCRSSGQSQGCCQQPCREQDLLPSLPWGHDLVVPAAGFLKQLLTGCTRWIYPLNPTTFHVLINNANIFCDSYPPNIFSLGCPSATAQAREGSYRSVQITMLRPCAMAGRAGRFLCYSFSHHRSARGPGESAASRLKGSFGNGPGPCQVWQLPPQL